MEKNAIVAIVLSLLILLIWQQLYIAPQQKKVMEEQARQEELARQAGQTGSESSQAPVEQIQEGTVPIEGILPSTEMSQRQLNENAEDIVIDTPLLHVVITTQGARIKAWQLLAHKDSEGEPVELVSDAAQRRGQYPLEIFTGDAPRDEELNTGLYQSAVKSLKLQPDDDPVTVSFWYTTQSGVRLTKEMRFSPDSYKIDLVIKVADPAQKMNAVTVVWGPGLGSKLGNAVRFEAGTVTRIAGQPKAIRTAVKKIEGLMTHRNVEWSAINRKYFTAAFFAGNTNNTLSINKVRVQQQDQEEKIVPVQQVLIGLSQSLSSGESHLALYAGPKQRAELAAVHQGFEQLIDYGFFRFIAEPMARFMNFLYLYVRNYGVVIICLTIMIKIIFYPLTHKSFSSMKRMQDLQPQMKALQQKHKDDKQKLNQETMKLYKERGVNPMGGCLPMVLQIPVFFALYQTLSQSIELRGASFLWISDLSAPETIVVKPLVLMMGASMFLQQSMTPTAADNKQAQMFKFMPILFTAMFWNFPSGLVLYWFMNNILTIGQQYLINKSAGTPSKQPKGDNEETASTSRKRRKKGK